MHPHSSRLFSRSGSVVHIDLDEVRQLSERLKQLRKNQFAYAARDAVNAMAFAAKAEWPNQMKRQFTLRNKWTTGSIRVEASRGVPQIGNIRSRVGSLLPYMAMQEGGGTHAARGKHGVPIPTSTAAGQAMRARPRTRRIQRANYGSAIRLARAARGSRHQRNAVAIKLAAKHGGFAFLDLGKRKGIFRVRGTPSGRKQIRMIYDLSKRSVRVKAHPTLEPTVQVVGRQAEPIMLRALQRQVDLALQKQGFSGPVRGT